MILFLLWLLATLDAAFTGYRAVSGRNALINKGYYYHKAMLQGAIFGQIIIAITAGVTLIVISNNPHLLVDFYKTSTYMLYIYIPYTVIILVAFMFRAIPSVDIRSITSVVVFGPLTFLRPVVALIGLVWSSIIVWRIEVILINLMAISLMLSLEVFLKPFIESPNVRRTST